jgi:hypothetical protein
MTLRSAPPLVEPPEAAPVPDIPPASAPPEPPSLALEFSPLHATSGVTTPGKTKEQKRDRILRVGLRKSRTLPGNVWSNVTPATSGKSLRKVEFAKVSVFSPPVGRFSASEWRRRVPGAEELSER